MRVLFLASMLLVGCGGTVITGESGDAASSDTGDSGSTSDVASDTATIDAGDACGGSIGRACPDGSWCSFPEGACNVPGGTGVCRKREALPCVAPKPGDEVCGCDGMTYQSLCVATSAGMSIVHTGACESPPSKTCGGFGGATCASTEYCDYGPAPSYCGGDDGTGTCKPRPTSCIPADGIFCGCDGKVYESPCAAAKAGTGIRKNGPC